MTKILNKCPVCGSGLNLLKTILITVKVYDNSTIDDVERAISAGLDSNSIDCIYNVEEIEDD